jgi:proteasome accessory factor C
VLEPDSRWVAEYYPVEDVQELNGGRIRVRMRYGDRSWMIRLLLGLGGEVHVESPAELAAQLRTRARQALDLARNLSST